MASTTAAISNGTTPPPSQIPANPDTTTPTANSSSQPQSRPSPPEDSITKRPRDYHLIHAVLANRGVSAYEERVPLMLMDFAYRYTRGVLEDAQTFSTEAWTASSGGGRGGAGTTGQDGNVNLTAVRLAIASRIGHTFTEPLPNRELAELAQDVNRVQLPRPERVFGLRLPPEQFCLTGVGFRIDEQWESEGEEGEMEVGRIDAEGSAGAADDGVVGAEVKDEEVDEDEFEEVMGVGGEDREMGDA